MSLTEEQKTKIEEEEKYRAQVRGEIHKPKKKGMSLFAKILLVVFGFPLILAVIIIGTSSNGSTKPSNNTSEEKKELIGKVNFDGTQFHITNQEDVDWQHCYFTLNTDYSYPSDITTRLDKVAAGQTLDLGAGEFTLKDGTRFNPFAIKPKGMGADCDGRTTYWSWN